MLVFNQHLLSIICVIVVLVGWALYHVVSNFIEFYNITSRKLTHSKELEIIWTAIPAFTLLILSVPSFSLLYAMDEVAVPGMTAKVVGHQWFWCYEVDDFLRIKLCEIKKLKKTFKYTSYLFVIDGLPGIDSNGYFRLLDTTKRMILPIKTFLRLLITSADVLHSWSVPAFGVKMDACPGRLNQITLFIEKLGMYYGACYEICGVQHGFMPITVVSTLKENVINTFSTFFKS